MREQPDRLSHTRQGRLADARRTWRGEDGFALPFTIFLVTIITIMLAAAFTRATADHMVASNSSTEVSALAVAQSGLQSFFADSITDRPMPGDSFRYNVTGGYAWIHPRLVYQPEPPPDTVLGFTYIIRSVGSVIDPSQGPTPLASRTIAQFARWHYARMPTPAAFVAINGIDHLQNVEHQYLRFTGVDESACPSPTPTILDYRGPNIISGVSDEPGTTHAETSFLVSGTREDVADETGIDWDAIVNDSAVTPDFASPLPGDTDYWTYVMDGDYTLSGISGTGLLIVTGNLRISAGASWRGVILVGGRLIMDPSSTSYYGIVVTGLNEIIGPGPAPNDVKIDDIEYTFRYSSCSIEQAMRRFGGFQSIANAWVDNWATY